MKKNIFIKQYYYSSQKKNKIVSSSLIRKIIYKGRVQEAEKLLGRPWCVEGEVIKGAQRGRKIGFPTCNIKLNLIHCQNLVFIQLGSN